MSKERTQLKILLVDDSDDDRFLFNAILQKSGLSAEVIEKEDGDEAVEFFKQLTASLNTEWPEAVFLDLKMPQRNGFEVLQWVKDRPALKPLRIFVLSGSSESSDIERARALGAVGYFVKPLTSEKIRELFSSDDRTAGV